MLPAFDDSLDTDLASFAAFLGDDGFVVFAANDEVVGTFFVFGAVEVAVAGFAAPEVVVDFDGTAIGLFCLADVVDFVEEGLAADEAAEEGLDEDLVVALSEGDVGCLLVGAVELGLEDDLVAVGFVAEDVVDLADDLASVATGVGFLAVPLGVDFVFAVEVAVVAVDFDPVDAPAVFLVVAEDVFGAVLVVVAVLVEVAVLDSVFVAVAVFASVLVSSSLTIIFAALLAVLDCDRSRRFFDVALLVDVDLVLLPSLPRFSAASFSANILAWRN